MYIVARIAIWAWAWLSTWGVMTYLGVYAPTWTVIVSFSICALFAWADCMAPRNARGIDGPPH